jgi:hypothetical protein
MEEQRWLSLGIWIASRGLAAPSGSRECHARISDVLPFRLCLNGFHGVAGPSGSQPFLHNREAEPSQSNQCIPIGSNCSSNSAPAGKHQVLF